MLTHCGKFYTCRPSHPQCAQGLDAQVPHIDDVSLCIKAMHTLCYLYVIAKRPTVPSISSHYVNGCCTVLFEGDMKEEFFADPVLTFFMHAWCMCTYICEQSYVSKHGLHRLKLAVITSSHSPPCFLKPGLSLDLELTNLLGWLASELQRSVCPCFPRAGITGTSCCVRLYTKGAVGLILLYTVKICHLN